jgi:RNA polymerase sigma factor (sigma-70 family)
MSYSELSHSDLVQACLTGNDDAWKEFRTRYKQVISLAVLRTARRWRNTSRDLLDDLIGDTYLKLLANNFGLLRNFEFRSDAAIFGFLKVIATNVVHDHFRHKSSKKYGTVVSIEEVYEGADPPIPSRTGSDDIERNVLIREVEEALNEVTGPDGERDRTIFWLTHRQGFTADAIAQLAWVDLNTKGVESVLYRLKRAVCERLTDEVCAGN